MPYLSDATVFSSESVSSHTVTASVARLLLFLPPDAVLLNKKAANAVDFNAQQLLNGDCYDQNGEIDGNDATALLKFLVHIIKALPETSDLNA